MFLVRLLLQAAMWCCQIGSEIVVLLQDKRASGKLPDNLIKEIAQCLLPGVVEFCTSEEGKLAFEQWQKQEQKKTN